MGYWLSDIICLVQVGFGIWKITGSIFPGRGVVTLLKVTNYCSYLSPKVTGYFASYFKT